RGSVRRAARLRAARCADRTRRLGRARGPAADDRCLRLSRRRGDRRRAHGAGAPAADVRPRAPGVLALRAFAPNDGPRPRSPGRATTDREGREWLGPARGHGGRVRTGRRGRGWRESAGLARAVTDESPAAAPKVRRRARLIALPAPAAFFKGYDGLVLGLALPLIRDDFHLTVAQAGVVASVVFGGSFGVLVLLPLA